jgi:hypothetical protein
VRVLLASWIFVGLTAGTALAAPPRIAVTPFEGPNGTALRAEVVRVVRSRGFRTETDLGKASGTGQYFTWAQERGLAAFVAGDLETFGKKRQRLTFLVWNGHDTSVLGRWTVTGTMKQLPRTIAREFWKRLGPALQRAEAPGGSTPLPPAPPMRIDASSAYDDNVVGRGWRR